MPTLHHDDTLAEITRALGKSLVGVPWSVDQALAFFQAAQLIAGADGVSDDESRVMARRMASLGLSQAFQQAVFDGAEKVAVEAALRHFPEGGAGARAVLAFAVTVAAEDGFSPGERAAVESAAIELGLDPSIVDVLHANAEIQRLADDGVGGDGLARAARHLQRALVEYRG